MPNIAEFSAQVVADTFISKASSISVGVLGENLPSFDVAFFVKEMEEKISSPFWLALLGAGEIPLNSSGRADITFDVNKANVWRNLATQEKGKKLYIVILGPTPKLKSLRDLLVRVTEDEVRPVLQNLVSSWLGTEARKALWKILCTDRDSFKIAAILDLAATMSDVAEKNANDLPLIEEKQIFKVGMLPYQGLLDLDGPKNVERAIKNNITLVERIKLLQKRDIQTIARILDDEATDAADRKVAKVILAFSRSKDKTSLKDLSYVEVARVLSLKPTPKGKENENETNNNPIRKERELGDESAIKDLIRNDGKNIGDIFDIFQNDDDYEPKEFKTEGRTVIQKFRVGTAQVNSAVTLLINEECFGGIVKSEVASDYIECLKVLESGETDTVIEFFQNDNKIEKSIRTILDKVLVHYGDATIGDACSAWGSYVESRNLLLEYKHELSDHPLLLMVSNPDILNSCDMLIKSYGHMVSEISKVCDELRGRDINVSKGLMASVVALDVVYLDYTTGCVAIAGPTHPFHLWRWVEIARLFINNRTEMAVLGEDLLLRHAANPPVFSPHITLSCYLAPDDLEKDRVFIGIGSLGALPLYGDPESRIAAKFRAEEIGDIASRFIALAPYAGFGFEVVAIDPPSISDIIEALISVNRGRNRNNLIPVHVRIFYSRGKASLTDEENNEMEELATVIKEIRGTLEVDPKISSLDEINAKMHIRPVHYALVFEPGDAQRFDISVDFSPTLSPLVVPRHYHYSEISDRFDVIIHGNALPFSSYYEMFRAITNIPDKQGTFGRRSGAGRNAGKICKIAKNTMWISVIDQGIEPTFKVDGTIRLDKRTNGGRDIHTFTAHPSAITRYVRRVIEKAGLVPDDATQKRTFHLMQKLGGDTIPLAVASVAKNGQIIQTQAKGLLGVLSVKAWYEIADPDALLISLDTEASRRWILGSTSDDDNRRGDLLCLRQTHDGLQLEIIEVKARDEDANIYNVTGATTIEGLAIGQIDNTISILKRILPKVGTTSIDKARREVLRDQLYMAVAHREIPSEQRIRAVNMLKEFFDADDVNMVGRLFVVHVETQRTPKYPIVPKENKVQSPQGNPIEVYEILESEADIDAVAETASMSTGGEPFDLSDSGFTSEKTFEHKEANISRELVVSTHEPIKQTTVQIFENEPVFIGKDPLGNDITWDSTKNPNFGIMVTGDPGYGKTQTIRALMSELRKKGYPVLVFDFKNDYSDNDFVKELNLKVYDIVENGLPFNPLTLLPNETGMVQPIRQCHDLTSIIARVEGLKEQQQYRLVEAMKRSYEKHGIDPKAKVRPEEISSEPIFDEVLEELANDDDVAKTVLYRLQKFSDLGLFPTTKQEVNFDELIQDGVVLTMNDEANAPLMQILAEIMIVKLHALVKRGDQPRALKRLLVFDEAWRIAKSQRLVELAREGRSFGLGIIVGTQKPKDIPENLMSCLRTQIYLFNNEPDDQKIILKSLCNTTSGSTAERLLRVIKGFGKFEGYISSAQYQQGVRVNIVPHYDRS